MRYVKGTPPRKGGVLGRPWPDKEIILSCPRPLPLSTTHHLPEKIFGGFPDPEIALRAARAARMARYIRRGAQ